MLLIRRGKALRKSGWFFVAIMTLGVFLPSLAHSEFYVGGYLGPSFVGSVDPHWEFFKSTDLDKFDKPEPSGKYVWATRDARGVSVDPSLLLGGKIGYWFTRKSVFGLQMPSWLKYFGFELDISYQSLHWPAQDVKVEPVNYIKHMWVNASALTAAFLFLARYGFFPDAEVPFGRLQPYIGMGPSIFVSNTYANLGKDFRSTEADLGFAVEAGLRYMIYPRISLFGAFRYRYQPNHVGADDSILDFAPASWSYVEMQSTYQFYDLIFGVAYHF